MAIREIVSRPEGARGIVVDGPRITIVHPSSFQAPKAASFLEAVGDDKLHDAVEDLFEAGAASLTLARASASMILLETKMAELVATLDQEVTEKLGARLQVDRDQATETTMRLLGDHSNALSQLLARYVDPNSKDGLPSRVTEMLDVVSRNAVRQIDALLQDGDGGALAKLGKRISDEIKQVERNIMKELAARQALLTKSAMRGGRFEDLLAARLPILVGASGGQVDHCARVAGEKDRDAGDYVITVDADSARGEMVRIVVEAKSWKTRLSAEKIRQAMKLARANRGAVAGILIAETADALPDGLGFGQVSPCDYFVAFDPENGDEVALICSLYLARVAALTTIKRDAGGTVDLIAALREVGAVRGLLEQFAKLEICHSKVDKEVTNARTIAADIKANILAALRRLDAILEG